MCIVYECKLNQKLWVIARIIRGLHKNHRLSAKRAEKARYQSTYRGKVMHAKRQQLYMQRKREYLSNKKIMTDHSSHN